MIWGLLPKSAVDNETIEEAIARLIAVHLAAETAHLGTGESLQSHKASEIIDHIAGSIIEDKIGTGEISSRAITTDQIVGKDIRTATDVGAGVDGVKMNSSGIEMWQSAEQKVGIPVSGNAFFRGDVKVNSLEYLKFTLQSWFESLDGWTKTAGIFNYFGYVEIYTTTSVNNTQYLSAPPDDQLAIAPNTAKNPIFDATLGCGSNGNHLGYWGFGELDSANGVGFKVLNGSLYAIWYDLDEVGHTIAISGITVADLNRYRVEVTTGSNIKWYVNGILKETLTLDESHVLGSATKILYFWIKTTTAGEVAKIYAYRALFQQDF